MLSIPMSWCDRESLTTLSKAQERVESDPKCQGT